LKLAVTVKIICQPGEVQKFLNSGSSTHHSDSLRVTPDKTVIKKLHVIGGNASIDLLKVFLQAEHLKRQSIPV
jgi:hypothetical protein